MPETATNRMFDPPADTEYSLLDGADGACLTISNSWTTVSPLLPRRGFCVVFMRPKRRASRSSAEVYVATAPALIRSTVLTAITT